MATQKLNQKVEQARKVQIGDAINKSIIDKGKNINKSKNDSKPPVRKCK